MNVTAAVLLTFSRQCDVQARRAREEGQVKITTEQVGIEDCASLERVIPYGVLRQNFCIEVTENDLDTLMRIVEAEAGCEDRKGKLLVANVVVNRVKSIYFPDNVTDVVYQGDQNVPQFSPVANGSIDSVSISEETRDAVYGALRGEDVSNGALFFMARRYVSPENAAWFDTNLTFLFTHGGHDFFVL